MRLWKVWTCALALASGTTGAARADDLIPHDAPYEAPYGVPYGTPGHLTPWMPMVEFVNEPAGHVHAGCMGGVSIYFLRPYYSDNPAFVLSTGIGTANPRTSSEDFDWNYHAAPAFWLGYTSECGVGVRARYFHFDHDAESVSTALTGGAAAAGASIGAPNGLSPLIGTPPRGFQSPGILLQGGAGTDILGFGSDLHIQTIDAEATYAYDCSHFSVLVAVGGRYLQMHQNYIATLSNLVDPTSAEFAALAAGRNFYGAGPTFALQARWEFGHSGMSVFGSVRASILVGESHQSAFFNERITDPLTGPQDNTAGAESRDNIVVPVGEVEAGFEYGRRIRDNRLFFRGAIVNHTYFEAGSPSNREGAVGLFGAQLSMGVNY
jgi:hypothetical protein